MPAPWVLGSLCRELFRGASEVHGGRYGELHQLALRWVAAGWAAAGSHRRRCTAAGEAIGERAKRASTAERPAAGPSGKSLLHPSRWYCHLQWLASARNANIFSCYLLLVIEILVITVMNHLSLKNWDWDNGTVNPRVHLNFKQNLAV